MSCCRAIFNFRWFRDGFFSSWSFSGRLTRTFPRWSSDCASVVDLTRVWLIFARALWSKRHMFGEIELSVGRVRSGYIYINCWHKKNLKDISEKQWIIEFFFASPSSPSLFVLLFSPRRMLLIFFFIISASFNQNIIAFLCVCLVLLFRIFRRFLGLKNFIIHTISLFLSF